MNPDKILKWAKVGGVALGVYVGYKVVKGAGDVVETAKEVVTKDLNPASNENLVYRAASAGTDTGSLGSTVYDKVQDIKRALGFSSEHDLFEE